MLTILNKFDEFPIIYFLSYFESYLDVVAFTCTCRTVCNWNFIFRQSKVWREVPFRACMTKLCCCRCTKITAKKLQVILSTNRFRAVNLCGSLEFLCQSLCAISVNNSVNKLHFSITNFEDNHSDKQEFVVPSGLRPERFSNLKGLTLHSSMLTTLSLESCSRMFSMIGSSLTSLSMWPSSPIGIVEVLNWTCPNLLYLRIDSFSRFPDTPPVMFSQLEEIVFSYPAEYLADGGYVCPQLKKISIRGLMDDAETICRGLSYASNGVLECEFGDSSDCASDEVICAITRQFPLLQKLKLASENEARTITTPTMVILRDGCPLLSTLDLSAALVYFDDDALEVLGSYPRLQTVSLGFTSEVSDRMYTVLANSATITHVTFVLLIDDIDLCQEARHALDVMKEQFRHAAAYFVTHSVPWRRANVGLYQILFRV
eukprot:gene8096-16614_t